MKKHEDVMKFINLVKGQSVTELLEVETLDDANKLGFDEWDTSSLIIEEIFMSGCCGRFALLLKFVFPEAKNYVVTKEDGETALHVITEIAGRYYDIRGEYDINRATEYQLTDEEEILDNDVTNNYSFNQRGNII